MSPSGTQLIDDADPFRPQQLSCLHLSSGAGAGAEMSEQAQAQSSVDRPIRLYIPQRYLLLTSLCGLTGLLLGLTRGARAEGLRFLAENAHRPPTTMRGWYLYKKTKNYRMIWGGLQMGGREALKLGAVGCAFAAAEDGMSRVGLAEAREAGAGLVTATLFCAMYRIPWVNTRRVVLLGGLVGGIMSMLRRAQGRLEAARIERREDK